MGSTECQSCWVLGVSSWPELLRPHTPTLLPACPACLLPACVPHAVSLPAAAADTPEVTTALLKFMAEFVLNKTQRLTFDSSSPNGILLFREVSKVRAGETLAGSRLEGRMMDMQGRARLVRGSPPVAAAFP